MSFCDLKTSRMRSLKPASGLQKPVEEEEEELHNCYNHIKIKNNNFLV
jgi:hypothetical protein